MIVNSERPEVIVDQYLIKSVFDFVFYRVEHCSDRFENGLSVLEDFNTPTRYDDNSKIIFKNIACKQLRIYNFSYSLGILYSSEAGGRA